MCLGLLTPTVVHAQEAKILPANDRSRSAYGESNLFALDDGFERVQYTDYDKSSTYKPKVSVEKYSRDFQLLSSKSIDMETIEPADCADNDFVWGGVYEGKDWNFIITGKDSDDSHDDVESYRVTRFTKSWEFSKKCALTYGDGVGCKYPMRIGGCVMTEWKGELWISTGHTDYHTGKQNMIIDIDTMKLLGHVEDYGHSFDQYLAVCNDQIYQMEESERDRCVYVEKQNRSYYSEKYLYESCAGADTTYDIFDFFSVDRPGDYAYSLYGSTGGFKASDSEHRLLSTLMFKDVEKIQKGVDPSTLPSNVMVCSTTDDLKNNEQIQITHFDDDSDIEVGQRPYLVKVNDNRFAVIWGVKSKLENKYTEDGKEVQTSGRYSYTVGEGDKEIAKKISDARKVQYCFINAKGELISDIKEFSGSLSTCQPTVTKDHDIVWYSTHEGNPEFYIIHEDGTNQTVDTNITYNVDDFDFQDITVTYDGENHKLPRVKNLPEGVKVDYGHYNDENDSDNLKKDARDYSIYASFSADDPEIKLKNNHTRTAHLIIKPKDLNSVHLTTTDGKELNSEDIFIRADGILLYCGTDYTMGRDENYWIYRGIGNYTGEVRIPIKKSADDQPQTDETNKEDQPQQNDNTDQKAADQGSQVSDEQTNLNSSSADLETKDIQDHQEQNSTNNDEQAKQAKTNDDNNNKDLKAVDQGSQASDEQTNLNSSSADLETKDIQNNQKQNSANNDEQAKQAKTNDENNKDLKAVDQGSQASDEQTATDAKAKTDSKPAIQTQTNGQSNQKPNNFVPSTSKTPNTPKSVQTHQIVNPPVIKQHEIQGSVTPSADDSGLLNAPQITSSSKQPSSAANASVKKHPQPQAKPKKSMKKDVLLSEITKNLKSEEAPKGSHYAPLSLQLKKAAKNSIVMKWRKVKGCRYILYTSPCGHAFKKKTVLKKESYTLKKLKKNHFYKCFVVAVKGQKVIAISKAIHVYTGKGNVTKIKVNKVKKLKKGQNVKLKLSCLQKVKKHRSLQLESSNSKIIKVTHGKLNAIGKGKAVVRIYAQDGKACTLTIRVV